LVAVLVVIATELMRVIIHFVFKVPFHAVYVRSEAGAELLK
jgi:hypothetical protein